MVAKAQSTAIETRLRATGVPVHSKKKAQLLHGPPPSPVQVKLRLPLSPQLHSLSKWHPQHHHSPSTLSETCLVAVDEILGVLRAHRRHLSSGNSLQSSQHPHRVTIVYGRIVETLGVPSVLAIISRSDNRGDFNDRNTSQAIN
eukprot:scaffold41608_cov15-Tisochrysis_lutea.AAC.1